MSPALPVADDYFPAHGDPSYDVDHYDLSLEYTVEGNHLSGRAVLTATCRTPTDRISLDLYRFIVSKVSLDGRPAHFTHRGGRLVVRTPGTLLPGQRFSVSVAYRGRPAPVHGAHGEVGWEELSDGVIVASQPDGAPSWFPCNDRPANKATYRIEVVTATAYQVTVNGTLLEHRRGASRTTWVYEMREPMATYLATVQVGRYAEHVLAHEPVRIAAVHPPSKTREVQVALRRQPEMMAAFVGLFGPYPFGEYSVVVTDDELEIPLEAQGLATFGSNHMDPGWKAQRLLAHELAHQWFGNSLTLRAWRDIWLHEGFACYSEWLWSELSGGRPASAHAAEHWNRLAHLPQDLLLTDPGPDLMFDDRVYKRGALALHALRVGAGDELFFGMLRSWVSRNAYRSVTTGDFIAHVQRSGGLPIARLLDPWLFTKPLPPLHGRDETALSARA
jgi:aminopeptidase N